MCAVMVHLFTVQFRLNSENQNMRRMSRSKNESNIPFDGIDITDAPSTWMAYREPRPEHSSTFIDLCTESVETTTL